ncbi:hypothetical protein [Sinorhizobium sp. RAC02]|uniref:hypothetical protein n=1 Tax=Sinorhizobium sp. RAC02 TaxID=1842534 RepID=UPI0008563329|nr:hypothetical protein [Sinorhizobium sp. RAC02]AOF89832.1 hypothetical protein BSY16_977 [Sinorhizobium sp. RAC02]
MEESENAGSQKFAVFKTSPLFRLTATYDEDLEKLADPDVDKKLAVQLVQRLAEAKDNRDSNVRALFIADVLLAVAVSGKNFTIPGTDISTRELPAVLEVLIVVCTFALVIAAVGFTTWLCYSQLLWTVMQRRARAADIAGGIMTDAEHFNEMSVRLFQDKIALAGIELFTPMTGYKAVIWAFAVCSKVLFGALPIMHALLIVYGLAIVCERSGFDVFRALLILIVFVGHVMALILWFAPNARFNFKMRLGTYTRQRP